MAAADVDPIERILAFLNSIDVEVETDAFAALPSFRSWSEEHVAEVSARQLDEQDRQDALQFREALRTVARGQELADPTPVYVPLRLHLDPSGNVSLAGTTPAAAVASAVAELDLRGDWSRVKICPADDCQWAFYDKSRNRSRHWCSMAECGNRAKVRAHRQRIS